MGEREDRFDDKLRSLMENAEERVPKRVWSEVSKRLAASGRQKTRPVIIPLWARWSAVGVAVAAALVLGVFLFMRGSEAVSEDVLVAENTEPSTDNAFVVENIESEEISEEVAEQPVDDVQQAEPIIAESEPIIAQSEPIIAQASGVPASNEGAAVTSDEISAEPAEGTSESSLAEQIANAPKYIAEATEVTEATEPAKPAEPAEAAKPWSDPFADPAVTTAPNKIRTALTVSGDAFGNASTGSSSSSTGIRRQMSSSIDGQPAEGIAEKSDSNYGIPATFGVGVKILFTPRWSLGVGVNYSLLSRTFSGEYTSHDASGEVFTNSYSNIRHRVDYIGIPVNAYFSIIQSHAVDFYVYAGGTVEKAVSSRYILDHGIPSYKESVKGVQCSADVGIGVEFIVVDWLGIYIDPSLRYYFPNSHQPKSIRTQEPLNFGFEIGLRFRL